MEQVEVEILSQTITSQYGVLSAGDILRTDAAFAAHLVDDCMAAKYTKAKPKATSQDEAKDEPEAPATPAPTKAKAKK